MLPLLPTGQQEFSEIRQTGRLYVDKTEFIYRLITHSSYFFFLSRPRRFGKSLLINTFKELFSGKKELFEGLFIYNKITWETHPVIHIDFSNLDFQGKGLNKAISDRLDEIAQIYFCPLQEPTIGSKFKELIQKLYKQTSKKVIILIDEYDKPITDTLESGENIKAHEHREILRGFYSVVKGSSAYIRFFFLTGITRFSKISIFSDLNNLVDITFDDNFHNLLGYTQSELESYFQAHLNFLTEKFNLTYSELIERIKFWYNGYSWNSNDKVYNPFSVLRFLEMGKFMNFWFESGTPKMLVELLKKDWLYDLRNLKANFNIINNFDFDNLNIETILFQTGYLTIAKIDKYDRYILNYPNQEVEQSLLQYLLSSYSYTTKSIPLSYEIASAIESNDFEYLCQILNQLFASIPYQIFLQHSEKFFHSIVFIALKLCGFYIESEVSVSTGRIDAVLSYENRIYIFEFKLDQSPEIALEQIQEKSYFKKYLSDAKKIYWVGIHFSSLKKEIENYIVQEFKF
jgi:hypothetical protein